MDKEIADQSELEIQMGALISVINELADKINPILVGHTVGEVGAFSMCLLRKCLVETCKNEGQIRNMLRRFEKDVINNFKEDQEKNKQTEESQSV